ncbi:ComEC/Rec2 family competence protein [Lactiplantibacillus carotarum]|uniref:ComEC/Rec2 family competence protein n=1 Tax=Lactiplantibacillus carotarum TaxID=2993456 RepID=UPI00298F1523|nr:ComEC/Rec2 family competence protein [Lactiplantibacillus carotarum]
MAAPFFAAIAAGLLSSWLVGHQWIAAVLLVLWLGRVVRLRDRRCIVLTGIVTVATGGWLSWKNANFKAITAQSPVETTVTVSVQPDAVTTRGGRYQLIGTSATAGKLILAGRLASASEQVALSRLDTRTVWRVQGRLGPVAPPTNPGQFDAPSYYRSQGILQQVAITRVIDRQARSQSGWRGVLDKLHTWRQHFVQHAAALPPTLRLYATSLLVGMRPANFHTTMAGVQQLGLLHLFSLSGMHVILFLGLLRWGLIRLHLSRTAVDWWLLSFYRSIWCSVVGPIVYNGRS